MKTSIIFELIDVPRYNIYYSNGSLFFLVFNSLPKQLIPTLELFPDL